MTCPVTDGQMSDYIANQLCSTGCLSQRAIYRPREEPSLVLQHIGSPKEENCQIPVHQRGVDTQASYLHAHVSAIHLTLLSITTNAHPKSKLHPHILCRSLLLKASTSKNSLARGRTLPQQSLFSSHLSAHWLLRARQCALPWKPLSTSSVCSLVIASKTMNVVVETIVNVVSLLIGYCE